MRDHIQTPRGGKLTLRQYVVRAETMADAPPCEHGHFGCAAWERGPCSAEVAAEEEDRDA